MRDYPGELLTQHIDAVVLGSDIGRVGQMTTSDGRINRLLSNISWSVRGNLISVPTDCPQRDERLGWLGDAGLIMATANHVFDLSGFIGKWLVDIRDGQSAAGAYPDVAPRAVVPVDGAPGWADAGILVPWTTYLFGGDVSLLRMHHDSMVRFMDHVERSNPGWLRENAVSRNYGDWLSLDADTPKTLVAAAYWKRSSDAMIRVAGALQLDDSRWVKTSAAIFDAFVERFVSSDGSIGTSTQAGYALALDAGLVPEQLRPLAAQRLASDIAARGTALSTGIHGLRALMPALTDNGLLDVAFALLEREEYPSWLYPVGRGATTIWERWDGYTDERGYQTPAMNSLNHYALGSVGEWLYGYLGGLKPASPGYRTISVKPHPGGSMTSCAVSREVSHGRISVEWHRSAGNFDLDVTIPEGLTAVIAVPCGDDGWETHHAEAGEHHFSTQLATSWIPGIAGVSATF